jgi:hypothetical protein
MTSAEMLDRVGDDGSVADAPPVSAAKRFVAYVALATVVPFAMLLVLEGLASMVLMTRHAFAARPQPAFAHVVHDSLLGWVGQPNVALPNAFGPHLSLTRDAHGIRVHSPSATDHVVSGHDVVCSGSSLADGAGVADSQTMCADIERALPGVRTIEMAQEGYGVDQAYLRYVRDGADRPHRLHVFAFTGGDVERMARASERGYARPRLEERDGRLVAANVPLAKEQAASRWPQGLSVLSESRLVHAIERRTGRGEAHRARERERAWSLASTLFRDLDSLERSRGSRLVLVYLPALSDLRPGGTDARRAALAAFSRRRGIAYVDLTAELRAVSPDTADWFFITPNALPVRGLAGHYTAEGHRWVAARIAERVQATPDLARAIEAAP